MQSHTVHYDTIETERRLRPSQFVTSRNHISQVSDYPSLPFEYIFRPEGRGEVINDLLFVLYSCPIQIL